MPRRKKPFIDRSRARTYDVVYRPIRDGSDGSERVLRFVPRGNSSILNGINVDTSADSVAYQAIQGLDADYARNRNTFLLGEHGLPDDGYDYSVHFKEIGAQSSGAVFISKDGRTNLDGKGSASEHCRWDGADVHTDVTWNEDGDHIDDENDKDQNEYMGLLGENSRGSEDERRRLKEVNEIESKRKLDRDLDDVMAALESDSESSDETASRGYDPRHNDDIVDVSGSDGWDDSFDGELDDKFFEMANGQSEGLQSQTRRSYRPEQSARKARMLDDQFDKIMRLYNDDDLEDCELDDSEEESHENQVRIADDKHGNSILTAGVEDRESNESGPIKHLTDDMLREYSSELIAFGEQERCESSQHENGGLTRTDNDIDTAMRSLEQDFRRITPKEAYSANGPIRAPEALGGVYKALKKNNATSKTTGSDVCEPMRKGQSQPSEAQEQFAETFDAPALVNNDDDKRSSEEEGEGSGGEEIEDEYMIMYERQPAENWDCETVLSTYSNLDNHPHVIDDGPRRRCHTGGAVSASEIRLNSRISAPVDYLPQGYCQGREHSKPEMDSEDESDGQRQRRGHQHAVRNKQETVEQKRERKAGVKAAARERRAEKGEMKKAYRSEFVKQGNHSTKLGRSKVAVRF